MPILKENELKKHISAKDFQNIYVLYGQEKFLVKHYTESLIKKLMGETPPEFNFHAFGSSSDIDQVAVAAQIVPFMSEYNCVKVSDLNPEDLKGTQFDKYLELLEKLPETTVLIITMPTLETQSKRGSKFAKILSYAEKHGVVCELKPKGEMELEKQLLLWANKRNCEITRINAGKIIEYCGTDLVLLRNELDKLCAYVNGGEITFEIIDKLVNKSLQAKIYALSDSVIGCKSDAAFQQLNALFYQKEEPVAILTVLGGAYVDIYRARVAAESGEPMKTIAAAFNYRNRAFVLDKALRNTRTMSTVAIRKSIDAIIHGDTQLKSVAVNQRLLVEKLVARLLLIAKEERSL